MHRYSFVSTRRDLLDAFAAERRHNTGMRPVVRGGVIFLGLFFLWGAAMAVTGAFEGVSTTRWCVWAVVGGGILWWFLGRPLRVRRQIGSTAPAQPVAVSFDEPGIHIDVEGVGSFDREWSELVDTLVVDRGVAIYFDDGVVNWLPERVFAESGDRSELVALLDRQMAACAPLDPEDQ